MTRRLSFATSRENRFPSLVYEARRHIIERQWLAFSTLSTSSRRMHLVMAWGKGHLMVDLPDWKK